MNIDEALTKLKEYMDNDTIKYHSWLNGRHPELPTTPHRMIISNNIDPVINLIKEIINEDNQEESE